LSGRFATVPGWQLRLARENTSANKMAILLMATFAGKSKLLLLKVFRGGRDVIRISSENRGQTKTLTSALPFPITAADAF
jgi:hypothetical protein